MTKYEKLLRDQRRIDRRNEILERDNNTCQRCERTSESTGLNVHHKYYMPNTEPWDYPDEALITWCAKCHREETILQILQVLNSLFGRRKILYDSNLGVPIEKYKSKYTKLSHEIAKLREKLRKIERGKK